MEPIGTSYLTPRFGSTLNGMASRDQMGRQQSSYIGTNLTEVAVAEIAAEIDRVLSVYQQGQVNQVKDAKNNGMLYMFSRGEILNTINSIDSEIIDDVVIIKAKITNGLGETFEINASINESGSVNVGTS